MVPRPACSSAQTPLYVRRPKARRSPAHAHGSGRSSFQDNDFPELCESLAFAASPSSRQSVCSLRLSVRTPPFHGGESGSIPLGSATADKLPNIFNWLASRLAASADWPIRRSRFSQTKLVIGPGIPSTSCRFLKAGNGLDPLRRAESALTHPFGPRPTTSSSISPPLIETNRQAWAFRWPHAASTIII